MLFSLPYNKVNGRKGVGKMKVVDPAVQSAKDNYHLLTGVVIPRPIAFITSQNDDGVVNAAPFSFFNVVAAEPPLIAVSVSRSEGQMTKDTAKNISASKEFVVHLVDENLVEQVNQAASSYPSSVSEVEETGLTLAPSKKVQVPGVQEASIRMECKLHQIVPLGTDEAYSSDLFIGEVVMFHISEKVIENDRVSAERVKPVSRLAGSNYSKLGQLFSLERPK